MLLLAAVLTVFIGAAHSYLGEKWLITPILALDNLPKVMGSKTAARQTLRAAWHITSLAWWAIAGLMVYLYFNPTNGAQGFYWMCAGLFGVSGIIPIIYGKGRHKSWIIFLTIAVIMGYLGLSR